MSPKLLTIRAGIAMNRLYMFQKFREGDIEVTAVMHVSNLYLWLERHHCLAIRIVCQAHAVLNCHTAIGY